MFSARDRACCRIASYRARGAGDETRGVETIVAYSRKKRRRAEGFGGA